MIRLQERRIERNKRFFKNQRVSVVRKGEPFRGPLRPRPVTKAFSRRANHQFTLVVLILEINIDIIITRIFIMKVLNNLWLEWYNRNSRWSRCQRFYKELLLFLSFVLRYFYLQE